MTPTHTTEGNRSLDGRTALVTGAASGIGLAVASALSERGAQVLVLDRNEEGARSVAEEIGGKPLVADLSDGASIDALGLGGLGVDILVNNAGIRGLLPGMYERGWGRLVHVSSVHGHRASPFKSAYVSAKHGLEGLSKVIALEAAGKGVTSNTVCPGYVRTPLVEGQIADQARSHGIPEDEVLDKVLLGRTPIKRLVEPAEVADLVCFLCGPGTDSVTGTSFLMDGGWTAT
jgi:3-hydroxybutyrate dehydrogenase